MWCGEFDVLERPFCLAPVLGAELSVKSAAALGFADCAGNAWAALGSSASRGNKTVPSASAAPAKTGSPQLADTLPDGGHYVNSVLIGYAPADAPQIAAAVVLEYGGGGANAAPILRAVLDAVFGS